ncbi:pyridoxamine 5'-phosphate oxidase family protein [Streptomyces sp. M19]
MTTDRSTDRSAAPSTDHATDPGADRSSLTAQDLEFLRRPLYGFLSVAGTPLPPQPRPVWFEATAEGAIQLFTAPDSLKVRRLRRDPRASIVVAAPVGNANAGCRSPVASPWKPTERTTCAPAWPLVTGTSTTRPVSMNSPRCSP